MHATCTKHGRRASNIFKTSKKTFILMSMHWKNSFFATFNVFAVVFGSGKNLIH